MQKKYNSIANMIIKEVIRERKLALTICHKIFCVGVTILLSYHNQQGEVIITLMNSDLFVRAEPKPKPCIWLGQIFQLTHLPLVLHISVSELGQHWFRQ